MEYLIGFLLIILLPASIIINILLIIRGINLVKQNEQLMDVIKEYDSRQLDTQIKVESMLEKMKEIDLNGSFESDDEVGSVFTQLKDIVETYKNEI
jgi:competence protein ComGC